MNTLNAMVIKSLIDKAQRILNKAIYMCQDDEMKEKKEIPKAIHVHMLGNNESKKIGNKKKELPKLKKKRGRPPIDRSNRRI